MKEKLCYVPLYPTLALEQASNFNDHIKEYELPSGEVIKVNGSRLMAPEALFYPDHIRPGDDREGLHKMVFNSIKECDIDIQNDLFKNILLCGGTTNLPGL